MSKKPRRRKTAPKPPSARQLLETVTRELRTLNQRYEGLFQFVNDPNTYAPHVINREAIPYVLERDMKAGETIHVYVPMRLTLGSGK